MKRVYLVDTNVPLMANRHPTPDMSPEELRCIQNCVNFINHLKESKMRFALDSQHEIFNEYRKNLSFSGQPGMGDQFFKWIVDHQWDPEFCDHVPITKSGDTYLEFPEHPELENFDVSDRKFIAVAAAHEDGVVIAQAADSKWLDWAEGLRQVEIEVDFLCEEYINLIHS